MFAIALLEISFIVLLVGMLALSGVFGLVIVARLIEPAGTKVFLRRLTGRPVRRRG